MDYKKWFKRYWYLRDWLKARNFDASNLDKVELCRGIVSRNLYIRKCCQVEFSKRVSGPILEVINKAQPFKNLYDIRKI